ncbi:primase C-terminal domain-containing protein [Virgibacillus salexigens]|uniref:Primase C-terminal 1 domain-containing protein n=1 Tax=Virgibacillus kapii TaxID=1638645 RepID=A0ABQ2D7J8_9BACI|nr:primase C-terminal domain-containing protein [Virgibacillus kapii]GGJ48848.1 hypothetical protein GCM10007111_08580 [Virgibacillus kapii]
MIYPEFKYVNVAVEGVHNRKGIYDISKLGNPTGKKETYCTYFRYDDEMHEHFQQKGTVSGFQGKAWADWLPIDIDSDDLQEAQDLLTTLCRNLQDYEIDINCCRFYFSGAKGFHVMIPSAIFQAKPQQDIHKRFRKVALELSKGINIDTSIYDKTRIFRLANTINSKTNLHKIELYPFEATALTIEDILERAKEPSEKLEIETEYDISEELSEVYQEDLQKQKENSKTKVRSKICMSNLMQGVGEGERDNVGVRVASHLKQSGLTPKMMWVALDEWNESNDPPLTTDELERIYEQGLQDYQFGCHDPILKQNCSPDCIFYKKEWARF